MKTAYPAIFRKEENGYFVSFPDLGWVTDGETLEEAKLMAGDLLNLWFEENSENIKPSTIEEIKNSEFVKLEKDDIILMIEPKLYESKNARIFKRTSLIEEKIEEKNYSILQLANLLQIDESELTKIIDGNIVPSTKQAQLIAEALDFDYKIFFTDNKPND